MGAHETGMLFLGNAYDLKASRQETHAVLYDPDDLTTHAVVVGMTGSGKTGLCVNILEEAALQGIPALVVDPKGDIANLLLHFPDLAAESFLPWVDPAEARRQGVSVEELAQATAESWKSGLASWNIQPERIQQVAQAVQYAVYTPGSNAGLPVNILSSFQAPNLDWGAEGEALREKVASTVTAILALIAVQADPMTSREHILLANIFERAWRAGKDLDLVELIRQVQSPPFSTLGALELEQFFPAQERSDLASSLNGLLASPSFQAWIEGHPLDIASLLWTPRGEPRQSVFYLAHLSDAERMFFVTLLLTELAAWMRAQPGSPSLRALLYFDELFGYMPPVENPPSKEPLLRLLKTARAYGVGLLLTTQNPVDLDYKGLGNAGTWFVGKLQTERDKARLLDGLEGSQATVAGFDRKFLEETLSDLDKRIFLLHNVHAEAPQVFQTRWAMAYLSGPITRAKLGQLNALVGAGLAPEALRESQAAEPAERRRPSATVAAAKPQVPAGVEEHFLPNNLTVAQALKQAGQGSQPGGSQELLYKPALLGQATARFLDRKIGLDHERSYAALVLSPDRRGVIRWEEHASPPLGAELFDSAPLAQARFADLGAPLNDAKTVRKLQADFQDYVYHMAELRLPANPRLERVADPGINPETFQQQCREAAEQALQTETKKLTSKYQKLIKGLEGKLSREQRELAEDQSELSARKMEEMATHAENVLGLFGGSRSRRRVSTSLTKRRMTAKAKADVDESLEVIEEYKQQLAELEEQLGEELDQLQADWSEAASQIEERLFTPYKKDILLDYFGVAWCPYWQLSLGGQQMEFRAFAVGE